MVEIINKSIQRIIWIYSIDVINRTIACDAQAQDYYMSKPLAPDKLETWLKTRRIHGDAIDLLSLSLQTPPGLCNTGP